MGGISRAVARQRCTHRRGPGPGSAGRERYSGRWCWTTLFLAAVVGTGCNVPASDGHDAAVQDGSGSWFDAHGSGQDAQGGLDAPDAPETLDQDGGVLPDADGSCPAPGSADFEEVETRCDGIDNDCDGLVDWLFPVPANACVASGALCGPGHYVCDESGDRVCLGPGPLPEVFDGQDNNCDGEVDNVPDRTVKVRAFLLVPTYLFFDGQLEIATVGSILEQWGLPYDVSRAQETFEAELERMAQYPLVIVPGFLVDEFLSPHRKKALEQYVEGGGTLVVFKPVFEAGSGAHALTGTVATTRRGDVDSLVFHREPAVVTSRLEAPEELSVPVNEGSYEPLTVVVMTPHDGTQTLASAVVNGEPVGALVTRRPLGAGVVYALGHNFHRFFHTRCYLNCFEPSSDLAGLLLREVFREATGGHLVLKHTVPGPEDALVVVSHDVDAYDAYHGAPAWGAPGALQVADLEKQHGARGSFLLTTDYVAGYYDPSLIDELCERDMCPSGGHTVVHGWNFGELPVGTCEETFASYDPWQAPTLCGEIRVSLSLLREKAASAQLAWRSPFLFVHPYQYELLETHGVLLDSSYAVGDMKFNLPISLARTGINQHMFKGRSLFTMPIALEDGIGVPTSAGVVREEMNETNVETFVTLWTRTMLRNSDNNAHTMALMHPSYGLGVPQDNLRHKLHILDRFLRACRQRGVKVDTTMADLATFWRAREAVELHANYTQGTYEGTLTIGAHPVTDLTLEFGDTPRSFHCPTCGPVQLVNNRVVLRGTLPAGSTHDFRAQGKTPR